MKRSLIVALLAIAAASGAMAQSRGMAFSLGAGYGRLSETFSMDGARLELVDSSLGIYADMEVDLGNLYIHASASSLVPPSSVSLGGNPVDLGDYDFSRGGECTVIGLGWLQELGGGLSLGGSLGFHMSMPRLSPNDDSSLLALEGNHGLIGVSVLPQLRYRISKFYAITLSVPVGFDFGPMSDGFFGLGLDTGLSSPPRVRPEGLTPQFRGWTVGAYLSVSLMYSTPLPGEGPY